MPSSVGPTGGVSGSALVIVDDAAEHAATDDVAGDSGRRAGEWLVETAVEPGFDFVTAKGVTGNACALNGENLRPGRGKRLMSHEPGPFRPPVIQAAKTRATFLDAYAS